MKPLWLSLNDDERLRLKHDKAGVEVRVFTREPMGEYKRTDRAFFVSHSQVLRLCWTLNRNTCQRKIQP